MHNGYCPNQNCPCGLDPEKVETLVECLNIYLANLNVLFIKLHNIHWNVIGVGFFDIHVKTEELYDFVADQLDKVAERIKALGCYPLASMEDYLEVATISELPSGNISTPCAAKIIVEDFCSMLSLVRKIDSVAKETLDECTIGLLVEAICFFEKYIWFFSAYLSKCKN